MDAADELKAHWLRRVQPMGKPVRSIAIQGILDSASAAALTAGVWPQDMDDRWVIWLDQGTLTCWRSWTGHCIYRASVKQLDSGQWSLCGLDVPDRAQEPARSRGEDCEVVASFLQTIQRAVAWQSDTRAVVPQFEIVSAGKPKKGKRKQ